MGFSQADCIAALRATKNDETAACLMLLGEASVIYAFAVFNRELEFSSKENQQTNKQTKRMK
jgi:hypothetical protein